MLGAIVGDVIGSVFERDNVKSIDFPLFCEESRFTDDSLLTIAVADCLLNKKDYTKTIQEYAQLYPDCGFGGRFKEWMYEENPEPYNSWGNGSAMRASPVAYVGKTLDEVFKEAKRSAEVTHNHPEGIKGAQAVAIAVFMVRSGHSKASIKQYIESIFDYDLSRTIDEIRPIYKFDVSCQGSVPESIIAFLESTSFEEAIRKAISIGGDSDTIASIAGAIAEPFYGGVPKEMEGEIRSRVPENLLKIVDEFKAKYRC